MRTPTDRQKAGAPRIVNVSSGGGQLTDGADGWAPAYCISKTALNGVTVQLAAALPDFAVNSVCPGPPSDRFVPWRTGFAPTWAGRTPLAPLPKVHPELFGSRRRRRNAKRESFGETAK
jgi:NAD(P)-dependent dehydrogenase (short-subunit alcohol dehydrogenase family)